MVLHSSIGVQSNLPELNFDASNLEANVEVLQRTWGWKGVAGSTRSWLAPNSHDFRNCQTCIVGRVQPVVQLAPFQIGGPGWRHGPSN